MKCLCFGGGSNEVLFKERSVDWYFITCVTNDFMGDGDSRFIRTILQSVLWYHDGLLGLDILFHTI